MLISLLLALAAPQSAASPAANPDYSQEIEVLRPRMVSGSTLGKPTQEAKVAIANWQAKGDIESLLLVQPFAEMGDPVAMRAMMDGFVRLRDEARQRDDAAKAPLIGRLEYRLSALAGLWAMQLWRSGIADTKLAAILNECVAPAWGQKMYRDRTSTYPAAAKQYDCGFDVTMDLLRREQLVNMSWKRYDMKKQDRAAIVFTERPVRSQAEVDTPRLALVVQSLLFMKPGQPILFAPDEDHAWANELARVDPAAAKHYYDAGFKRRVYEVGRGVHMPAMEEGLRLYVAADPARQKVYDDALKQPERARAAEAQAQSSRYFDFDEKMASGRYNAATDAYWMGQIAIESGGDRAKRWYAAFGGDLPGMPDVHRWCAAGVEAACDKARAQTAQSRAAQGYSGGTYAFGMTSADELIAKQREINRANCARALMGANISCSLP